MQFDFPSDIELTTDGSILLTGTIMGESTFGDNGEGSTTVSPSGEAGIFVAKYDSDGKLVWVRTDGGADGAQGNSISSQSGGSSMVTGHFNSEAIFGKDEPSETRLVAEGAADIFVASYGANGTLNWAKHAGASNIFPAKMNDKGFEIDTLSDGSSIVTGCFQGAAIFGKGEVNETTLVATPMDVGAPFEEVFVAKYNPDGSLLWARSDGGSRYDCGHGISVLADGSSLVTGTFVHQATFGLGELNESQLVSEWYHDTFIARYSPDGTLDWVSHAGGSGSEMSADIIAFDDGSSIVTGSFDADITFAKGEINETTFTTSSLYKMYIARYNPDGSLKWAKSSSGSGTSGGGSISIRRDGSFLLAGGLQGEQTFGAGEPNETTLKSVGGGDVYIASYMQDGNLEWACRIGGKGHDNHPNLSINSNGLYVTGSFLGDMVLTFNDEHEETISSRGGLDVFLTKVQDR